MVLGWLECVICGSQHSEDFPEDFPDEWKMCCYCLNFAGLLIQGDRDLIIEHYSILHDGKVVRLNKHLDKIEKYITLVG